MDTSQLAHPKGRTRKQIKAKADRAEALVERLTRAACVVRDGECRYHSATSKYDDVFVNVVPDWKCGGPSQWSHFGAKRRARTRGMEPEERHTTAGSLMLCLPIHEAYDAGLLKITALTRHGCDGRLKFRRSNAKPAKPFPIGCDA